jgi:alpha-1,3-rhamnosyl/mannosyltransferase
MPTATLVCDLVAFEQFRHAHRRARINERITLPLAVRRCSRLFCISERTADDLTARFPAAAAKIRITPLAASDCFSQPPSNELSADVARRQALPSEFVLAVGTIEPRKNIVRLIEAHDRLEPELRERFPLVLAGQRGWAPGPFDAAVAHAKSPVRVLGYVTDEELNVLYRRCTLFCYPSLHEGFGLPVLEAMTAGAPVITSTSSSLPEVAGNAARLVDPRDVGSIERALRSLLTSADERRHYQRRGPLRAKHFSWAITAQTVLDELRALGSATSPNRLGSSASDQMGTSEAQISAAALGAPMPYSWSSTSSGAAANHPRDES